MNHSIFRKDRCTALLAICLCVHTYIFAICSCVHTYIFAICSCVHTHIFAICLCVHTYTFLEKTVLDTLFRVRELVLFGAFQAQFGSVVKYSAAWNTCLSPQTWTKRDLLQCQKSPTTVSKETYYTYRSRQASVSRCTLWLVGLFWLCTRSLLAMY